MNIQMQAQKEELEASVLELQNRLEKLKDDLGAEKISQKEFTHWTKIYRARLTEVQKDLDILEETEE